MSSIKWGTHAQRKLTASERFWQKVDKSPGFGPNGDCWEWIGGLKSGGYGTLWFRQKREAAYRVSWILHHGEVPNGLCVCHSCDIRKCVKPSHLWLGTHQDNMMDARRKGRFPKGEQAKSAKLLQKKVERLRKLYKTGLITLAELAKLFDIGNTEAYRIVSEERWSKDYRGVLSEAITK